MRIYERQRPWTQRETDIQWLEFWLPQHYVAQFADAACSEEPADQNYPEPGAEE